MNITPEQRIATLEAANKEQQEFISMVVHELRTPLSGTKWTLKMLLDGDLAHFSPEQLHILDEGYRSNERMVDLLEELSRANKAQVWAFEYDMQPSDIEEMLESTITQFLPAARSHDLTIKFNRPESPLPAISVDPAKMVIVFEHLIENAVKYSPANEEITITLVVTDTGVAITCHNPGSTVTADDVDTIFNKYTRGSLATDSQIAGTGMGLFTMKKIVEDHKGTVTFESSVEEGTTVGVGLAG